LSGLKHFSFGCQGECTGITSGGLAAKSVPIGVNFFVPIKEIDKYVPLDFE